jgi:hypothetical protein
MTKKKRTYEQIIAMQAKSVRFQENLNHYDAAIDIEGLLPEEYAKLRAIEIVSEPVRKRRRAGAVKKVTVVPRGTVRIVTTTEWNEVKSDGRVHRHRVVETSMAPRSPAGGSKK